MEDALARARAKELALRGADQGKITKVVREEPDEQPRSNDPAERARELEKAKEREKNSWRLLVLKLAILDGDPRLEQLISKKHPELKGIAEKCGVGGKAELTFEQARENVQGWFKRGLKGSNRHGPAERAKLCEQLMETVGAFITTWQASPSSAAEALMDGVREEEGPLICSLLSKELEGSPFEELWISREKTGVYLFGEDRIRVAINVVDGQLMVKGYFDDDELQPAKSAIGPFLTVYFDGGTIKEANTRWKNFRATGRFPGYDPQNGDGAARSRSRSARRKEPATSKTNPALAAAAGPLPPGWEIRESRSKKGVFYFANEAKGLAQMERPKM